MSNLNKSALMVMTRPCLLFFQNVTQWKFERKFMTQKLILYWSIIYPPSNLTYLLKCFFSFCVCVCVSVWPTDRCNSWTFGIFLELISPWMLERLPRIPVTCRNASENAYKPLSILSRSKDISIADIVLKPTQFMCSWLTTLLRSRYSRARKKVGEPSPAGPLRREFVGRLVRVCFLGLKKNCSCSVIVVSFWTRSRSPSWQCSFKRVSMTRVQKLWG